VCKVYAGAWSSRWTPSELARNHRYFIETYETFRANSPEFVRLARFFKAEPSRHPIKKCRCGAPDRWKCWNRVFAREVLAEGRAIRSHITDLWWAERDDSRRQTQTGAVHSNRWD
jgi:hypothetical protein